MKAANHRLLGGSGWYYVAASSDAVTTIPHYGFAPTEDSVISAWSMTDADGYARDLVAYFNISGITITTDFPALVVPEKFRGSATYSFTLLSGVGVLLREG